MKILLASMAFLLIGCSPETKMEEDEPTDELWLMIKTTDFFRSGLEIEIEDKLIDIFERNGLGEIDGHSSGSYQFEVNFYDVSDFEKAKTVVEELLKKEYPNLEYVVSHTYETPFEKLPE